MPIERPLDVAEFARRIAAIEGKIDSIGRAVATLTMILTAPPSPGASARRAQLSPAQRAEENKRRAFKARVARAAKRYGYTLEEWVETFGAVDRLPPGARRRGSGRGSPLQ